MKRLVPKGIDRPDSVATAKRLLTENAQDDTARFNRAFYITVGRLVIDNNS